jgi:hypothetical protein
MYLVFFGLISRQTCLVCICFVTLYETVATEVTIMENF